MRRLTLCLIVLVLVSSFAICQDLAIGTKTAPAMVVAYAGSTTALETAQGEVESGLAALWKACTDAGLHPIGVPMLSVDLNGAQTGPICWEAWLQLADPLDPARLPDKPGLKIKQVPATSVAYTYHAGNPWQMDAAFTRLHMWATNQNLAIGSRARAIIYVWPGQKDDAGTMSECQLELRQ